MTIAIEELHDATLVRVTLDWGRSVSVMSVAALDGDASKGLLIVMQSGDRLVIRGDAQPGSKDGCDWTGK